MQSEKSEMVCATAYRVLGEVTYQSLFATFICVSTFSVKNENVLFGVLGHLNESSTPIATTKISRALICSFV